MHFKKTLLCLLAVIAFITSCNKWDDYYSVNDQNLKVNLLDQISQNPTLSKFYQYLQQTGLDKELSSTKSYTVWAPTDAALQSLDPATVSDPVKLKRFIGNHIANLTFFTRNAQTPLRVLMLNGKRVTFANKKFDDGTIIDADKYVSNGVLHIIDKAAPAFENAWELVNSTTTQFQQNAFILSTNYLAFDPALAIVDSINSTTGQPIYRPGTGLVPRNLFNDQVYDLKSEDKQYTFFILSNTAYTAEVNKLKPFYITGTSDSTTNLASFAVVKDLVVDTFISSAALLPATLTSKTGVVIPIDKSKIVETRKLSNGVAYVISDINFTPKSKIPTIVVQAEGPRSYFRPDGTPVSPTQNNITAVFNRIRVNPVTGLQFNDVIVYNHGISGLNAQYQARNLASGNYKVYWVAVNDTFRYNLNAVVNPVTIKQRLAMGSRTATNFPLMDVLPNVYTEVLLGDFNQATYGTLDMFLTANNSTAANANLLTLDYIKLVPDL